MSDCLKQYRILYSSIDWQDDPSLLPIEPPKQVCDWLLDSASLSKKLMSHCDSFEAQVLSHREGGAEVSYVEDSFLREVVLQGDGTDWVYALSAVAKSQLSDPVVSRLMSGDKPLGLTLFSEQSVSRDKLLFGAVMLKGQPLWARRSRLSVGQSSLWVSELFLPSSPMYRLHAR